ncbi:MAG: hypothetical protein LC672_03735, partial [Acidobacteria bacterium]|nr:hypothetical protein [Acidobacteriota bacterium]
MSLRWQISWGELFEALRPLVFVLAALVSTWVLADTRRRGFAPYAVVAWTLLTLFFTFIVLPLYLIARTVKRRGPQNARPRTEVVAGTSDRTGRTVGGGSSGAGAALPWRRIFPLLYASAVLALGTLYFYRDYRSVDAHLARAKQAKLLDQRERATGEYRSALRLKNDPHTHKLLGIE